MGLPRRQHPVEHLEGRRRPTGIDGVGQVPRRQRPGLAEERLEVGGGDRRPPAVGGGQGVEQAGEAPHVRTQVLAQPGLGRAVEPHRAALQVVGQPLRPGPAGSDRGVDHLAGGAHRLGQRLVTAHRPRPPAPAPWSPADRPGTRPAAWRRPHRSARPRGRPPPAGRPGTAAWCRRRSPHRCRTGRPRAAELLDHHRRVAPVHQPLDQGVGGLGHQRRVRALDQIGGPGGGGRGRPAASPARPGRWRPARRRPGGGRPTSWTRITRQPRATPSDAGGQRRLLALSDLEAENDAEEGLVGGRQEQRIAQVGQPVRGPQQGERLGRRLAQVEPGVDHDPVGGDAGGPGPLGPLEQERRARPDHVVVDGLGVGTRGPSGCGWPPPSPPPRPRPAGSPGRRTR